MDLSHAYNTFSLLWCPAHFPKIAFNYKNYCCKECHIMHLYYASVWHPSICVQCYNKLYILAWGQVTSKSVFSYPDDDIVHLRISYKGRCNRTEFPPTFPALWTGGGEEEMMPTAHSLHVQVRRPTRTLSHHFCGLVTNSSRPGRLGGIPVIENYKKSLF